jgi:hypothetical protein
MKSLYYFFFRVCLILIFFIYIYNPPVKFLPVYPSFIISLLSFILLGTHLILFNRSLYTFKSILPFLLILALLFFSLIVVFIHGTYETSIAKGYFLFLISYLLGPYVIIYILKKRNELNLSSIFKYLIVISVIQSIIMFLMLLLPNLKEFLFDIQKDDRQLLHLESGGFRMLGFAYGVVWDLGFVQSLSAIFIVWLIPRVKNRNEIWFLSLAYIIIFFSILLSGRTGFLGIFISLIILLYNLFSNVVVISNIRKFLVRIVVLLLITFNLIFASLSTDFKELFIDKIAPWAFEMFINNQEGNGFETNSTNNLKEMYFNVPFGTFFIGDGHYADPQDKSLYYLGTDAGYMRQLLFYGIIGSSILYFFYLLIFYNLIKSTNKYIDKSTAIMFFFIGLYYFFSHIKGDLFMGGDMPLKVLFLLYFFTLRKKMFQLVN